LGCDLLIEKNFKDVLCFQLLLYILDSKTMGYSTFRHFIKEQFPNLRFQNKDENPKVELSETTTAATTPSGKLKSGKNKQATVF